MNQNIWLGYCLAIPNDVRIGQIQIVASLINQNGNFVVDQLASTLQIGPTGKAFWHRSPAHSFDLTGSLVKFSTLNADVHGDNTTNWDWFKVKFRDNQRDKWDVDRYGFRIIDGYPNKTNWQDDNPWVTDLPEGETVFLRPRPSNLLTRPSNVLIGPWKVGRLIDTDRHELVPYRRDRVVSEYQISELNHSDIIKVEIQSGTVEFLLFEPDPATGKPIDLLSTKRLSEWFVEQLVTIAGNNIVAEFDNKMPGWKSSIKDQIANNFSVDFCRTRWNRIENSLNRLEFQDDAVNKLLNNHAFNDIFVNLVKDQVNSKVKDQAKEIEGKATVEVKATLDKLGEVKAEIKKHNKELKEVSENIQKIKESANDREQAISKMQTHLNDSRERLINDLMIYQSLLPIGFLNQKTIDSQTPPSSIDGKSIPSNEVVGNPIDDETSFIDERLHPSLALWHPGYERIMSVLLHAAVSGSKAVIIPSPAWAKAYSDALGDHARLTVVNVEPTWLGFGDLWKGGFGACWERALSDPSTIEIVLLRDFNHALPQCYARPLLDMIAGYCESLPKPASFGCWPKSLRLFACPAPAEAAIPLTNEVIGHFAAIQRELPVPKSPVLPVKKDGFIKAETWVSWIGSTNTAQPDQIDMTDFGPLACSVSEDVARIAKILEKQITINSPDAKEFAIELRVTNPREYILS